jgi:hypothetical protein
MFEETFPQENLIKKFITVVELEGALQKYKVLEDSIMRDIEFLKIIVDEKPNFIEWRDKIHYRRTGEHYEKLRDIQKDMIHLSNSIKRDKNLIEKVSQSIDEKCRFLDFDSELIRRTKNIPIVRELLIFPSYTEYLGGIIGSKRTFKNAFGRDYSEMKLFYYT